MVKQPPFKTQAGLQIGCMYQANPPVYHDRDALRLQSALLNTREPGALEMFLVRMTRRFWAWC